MDNKYIFSWVLGDWSDDGHGMRTTYEFGCNYSHEDIKDAYNRLIKRTRFKFHDEVCKEYSETKPDELCIEKLNKLGLSYNEKEWEEDQFKAFIDLFIEFMKLELPDLNMTIMEDTTPTLFGFWKKDANYSFGYGLFGE